MTDALEKEKPEIIQYYRDSAPVGRLGVPQDLRFVSIRDAGDSFR